MSIGIYALYWEKPDQVYIGQTINLKRRKYDHLSQLRDNTHENYKVQETYSRYGQPEIIVLQECRKEELNRLEAEWAKEFDNLLNIVEPGIPGGSGLNGPASVYSKRTILKVFSLIYKYNISYREIVKIVKLSKSSIERIGSGTAHTWLLEEYPEKYALMKAGILKRSKNKSQIK